MLNWFTVFSYLGLPRWLSSKESTCNARDSGLIPGLGRFPGEGHGYPLQYSCLENPMDRGAWQATVHGVTKSQTQLSNSTLSLHFNQWASFHVVIGHLHVFWGNVYLNPLPIFKQSCWVVVVVLGCRGSLHVQHSNPLYIWYVNLSPIPFAFSLCL